MTKQLVNPLGSYPDRDEFQIGRMLVWVKYTQGMGRAAQLAEAEIRLPMLLAGTDAVETLVAKSIGSSVLATVIGIHVEPNGSAEYDCTFFEGEHEDELFSVSSDKDGKLFFEPAL